MSDIAEKLRELSRWLLATDTDIKMPDGMIDPEIAADYTEALEAYVAEKKLLAAENERLRAEVERLRAGGCARDQNTTQYCAEAARLAADNERLRTALQEAFEVYAGSDGFIPETAAEGYQQQVIKQIINCINAGLAHYRTRAMSDAKTPDEQLLALKVFARWAIKNSAWVGCYLDGGAVQDEALKLGIIEERTATKDNFAEWQFVDCVGLGDTFYVFADWVKKVPAKDASDESPEGKAASEGGNE